MIATQSTGGSFADTSLTEGTHYWYQLVSLAQDGSGRMSAPSNTADFSANIEKNGLTTVTFKAPAEAGVYRLYCYVRNEKKAAAVASIPIKVKSAAPPAGK